MELLLESSASLDAWNKKQETLLKFACVNKRTDMAQFLIDCGSGINLRDKNSFILLDVVL
jgi:ankyrin repeat protein